MIMFKLNRDYILPREYYPKEEILEIHLQLFSILRDILPPELKGRTVIQLNEGSTLKDLLTELDINRRVAISVNDLQERKRSYKLEDGDEVKIFTSVGGG
jgi:thiamine biosynthesis protein ThiS